MKHIETYHEFKEVKENMKSLFVFSADWCPDCRVIYPILSEIESKYSSYAFYYVDRDKHMDICGELDIFGIPSFVAYDQGVELGRFVSKDRKTQEEIEKFMESL